jgi:hypothetical protein
LLFGCRLRYRRPPPLGERDRKQSLQYTGRSPRGWNGTSVSRPHAAHVAGYIWRGPDE